MIPKDSVAFPQKDHWFKRNSTQRTRFTKKNLPKLEFRFDFFVGSGISLEVNEGMMENHWESLEIIGNPYDLPTPWAAVKDKESIAFPQQNQ